MRRDEPADDQGTPEEPGPEGPEPDYADLFKTYVLQSVESTLATFAADAVHDWDAARARALHVLSFSLALAEAWPATRDLLLQLAPKMEQAGHRDDWLPDLERGVARSQAQHDHLAEAELARFIGELLRLRSKFDLARQWLDRSVTIFAALGADQGHARTLNELAFVAWQQHRYDEAEALAQRALTLLDANDPERATCFSRLGLVATDRQQWSEAERYHRTALEIRQQQGDQRKIAWSLQNLGYALRGQGKFTEAIVSYQEAIAILEEIQDQANVAITRMNLSTVYSLNKQTTKALEIYGLAENTFRRLYDLQNLAKVLTCKGLDYLVLRDWLQAESNFIASSTLFQQIGDVEWRLNALDGLGLAYLNQNRYAEAGTIFQLILDELPQIAGTPMHDYLASLLPTHVIQAKQKESSPQDDLESCS